MIDMKGMMGRGERNGHQSHGSRWRFGTLLLKTVFESE
jgi:hypothetical protein